MHCAELSEGGKKAAKACYAYTYCLHFITDYRKKALHRYFKNKIAAIAICNTDLRARTYSSNAQSPRSSCTAYVMRPNDRQSI